jgi:uncharacterized spore protein YtfJ
MKIIDALAQLQEKISASATVDRVYGQPIDLDGHVIVPVARVAYAFGGGGGEESEVRGMGGGGGVRVEPLGYVTVHDDRPRFHPLWPYRVRFGTLVLGFGIGLLAGIALARSRG